MKNRRAFTLIELLVVIAIIAILAAILFPVFAQAKEAAKKTACLSNTKQISVSMMMYAQDYDDCLFNQLYPGGAAADVGYWITCMGYEGDNNCQYEHWGVLLQPYMKSKDLLHCPDNNKDNYVAGFAVWQQGDKTQTPVIKRADYELNQQIFSHLGDPAPSMTAIDSPADIGLFGDGMFIYSFSVCAQIGNSTYPAFPKGTTSNDGTFYYGIQIHSQGNNFGFADGHSKFAKAAKLPANHPSIADGYDSYYPVKEYSGECEVASNPGGWR